MSEKVQDLLDKAELHVNNKQFDEASLVLEEAEELAFEENGKNPDSLWKIYTLKGRVHVGEGDLDLAELEFDSAEDEPNCVVEEVQFWHGMGCLALGEKDRGMINLVCAYENGGEALFSNVDKKILAEVIEIVESG